MTLYNVNVEDSKTGLRTALRIVLEQLDYADDPDVSVRRSSLKTAAYHLGMIARRLDKLADAEPPHKRRVTAGHTSWDMEVNARPNEKGQPQPPTATVADT